MTISVENKEGSGVALLEIIGHGIDSDLVPFSFPSETVSIPAGTRRNLVRVPLIEASDGKNLTTLKGAREVIPLIEAMGKKLSAYIIESYPEGQGGEVNNVRAEDGTQLEDLEIIFIAG